MDAGLSGARAGSRTSEVHPADRAIYRQLAVRIGARVAVVSACIVTVIMILVVAYVAWKASPSKADQEPRPRDIWISLDTRDVSIAVIGCAVMSVVCAWVATWLIARHAAAPIVAALRMQREFVADASHELRTPLAVLGARAQQLRMMIPADDDRYVVVDHLVDDAEILADIIDDLLEAATGDVDPAASASLHESLDGAWAEVAVLAETRSVSLRDEVAEAHVAMPSIRLRRIMLALLDNAVAHSPIGAQVCVRSETAGGLVLVSVIDEGGGIRGIDPARVFDRFVHGEPPPDTAGRSRTGHGIGLALVRETVSRYGGDVRVVATGQDGTVIELRLPRSGGPK